VAAWAGEAVAEKDLALIRPMLRSFRFSLTFALLSSLACLLVLTWILLSLVSFKTAEKDLFAQKSEEGRILLASFLSILPESLAGIDGETAAGILAGKIARERDFAGLLVVDAHGAKVYALADDRGVDAPLRDALHRGGESVAFSRDGKIIFRYAAIRVKGELAGAARLALSLAGEQARLSRSRHIFLAYFLLDSLLLFVFGSFLLSRIVVVPIRRLLAATERIASGDYGHSVHVPGSAEIAELAESFNGMLEALRDKREEADAHMRSLEKANLELQAAREETIRSEKMASVGLLAAGMAHEIGTPLSAIIGYTGILRDELSDDPVKADYLRRIEQESARIDRIVRDLLNYARPTPAEYEEVDVAAFLAEVVEMLERQGIFKKIRMSLSVMEGIPPLFIDRHQLLQVMINLFVNARDAMPGGGELAVRATSGELTMREERSTPLVPLITMGRRKEDFQGAFRASFFSGRAMTPCVKIEVSDSGMGIDEEHIGRLFDPFFTTKEPGKGTGLGLSISARIIDAFGGRITVASAKGQGTTFTVWLPIQEDRGKTEERHYEQESNR
jgi:signal transduction histidine kinase